MLTLTLADFEALRELIHHHCGIWLGDNKLTFLQLRLARRLEACGLALARDYYYLLKYDSRGVEEMQRLVDEVVVNETWFFRELGPLQSWCRTILPRLLERRVRLRVWSAGCATGEEPYTLAMLLLEAQANGQLEIVATDISHSALAFARLAVYDGYSLRRTEPHLRQKYFEPTGDGRRYKLREAVRRLVRFEHGNLVDLALARHVGPVEFVLCRNVMIYMSEPSRRRVLSTLYQALKPEGCLILGHSESLLQTASPFAANRIQDHIIYRKTLPLPGGEGL
jgi:chemotaxis protein methyltransferase CheR